jgi:hypothetical protein
MRGRSLTRGPIAVSTALPPRLPGKRNKAKAASDFEALSPTSFFAANVVRDADGALYLVGV